jgi:hypothetical protein
MAATMALGVSALDSATWRSPADESCVARLSRNRWAAARGCDRRDRVDGVLTAVRACSGPGGGEVVAVQLGEVVGRHQ